MYLYSYRAGYHLCHQCTELTRLSFTNTMSSPIGYQSCRLDFFTVRHRFPSREKVLLISAVVDGPRDGWDSHARQCRKLSSGSWFCLRRFGHPPESEVLQVEIHNYSAKGINNRDEVIDSFWCKILPALWNHHHHPFRPFCTWPSGLLAFQWVSMLAALPPCLTG